MTKQEYKRFRIGLTRDFLSPSGDLVFGDIGLAALDGQSHVEYEFFAEYQREITPDQIADFDAVIVLRPRVTRNTLSDPNRRLALVARFGVGYDSIDVAACTEAGVMLTITPDGVRRPVAQAILTFILALAGKLLIKDHLIRKGRWQDAIYHMGIGVTGRTLGSIGLGNIGCELFRLAQPLDMRYIAYDPFVSEADAATVGVQLVDLETLLRESDFVCVNCPLSEATRHLVGARELALMKPTAYLINTARGAIVDERALHEALRDNRIAGAGLDVFEVEPTPAENPLLQLDNVIVTPHALAWTDECFRGNGTSACQSALAVARGEIPKTVVNREVLANPNLLEKLRDYAEWYVRS